MIQLLLQTWGFKMLTPLNICIDEGVYKFVKNVQNHQCTEDVSMESCGEQVSHLVLILRL